MSGLSKIRWILIITAGVFFVSCSNDPEDIRMLDDELQATIMNASAGKGLTHYILPAETDLASIPQDPNNPLTPVKIQLGKFLFHETGLGVKPLNASNEKTYSCASCHHVEAGFSAGKAQGIGEGGLGFGLQGESRVRDMNMEEKDLDVQPLRTPTALNTAYQENMLWNGQFGATGHNVGTESVWEAGTPIETNFLGYEGLETQAIAGMGVHRMDIDEQLVTELGYKGYFDLAFPDFPEGERYTKETAGLAMAAYERTLLSNKAPFQRWLRGDYNSMSNEEKEGAILFFGKAGCVSCHDGPSLALNEFTAVGMADLFEFPDPVFNTHDQDPANLGRASFSKESSDNYKFKIPQLYNLKDIHFMGHGASFTDVRDVVEYFNQGLSQNSKVQGADLDRRFTPLNLTDEEVSRLTIFIENALYDRELTRYVPSSLPSGNCFPNADAASKEDLGCD